MSKKSLELKLVRKAAKDIPPPSKNDLARLRNAMRGKIDTGEISETRGFNRLQRDANRALPCRGMIRDAIENQRKRHHLTVYRLWKKAADFHPALSQAAVHEFLKGQRQLELPSAEALMAAVGLNLTESVAHSKTPRRTKARAHAG